MNNAIVSRDEWLGARKALLAKERAMTHALDELRAERRQLPWVKDREALRLRGARRRMRRSPTSSAAAASSPSITSC